MSETVEARTEDLPSKEKLDKLANDNNLAQAFENMRNVRFGDEDKPQSDPRKAFMNMYDWAIYKPDERKYVEGEDKVREFILAYDAFFADMYDVSSAEVLLREAKDKNEVDPNYEHRTYLATLNQRWTQNLYAIQQLPKDHPARKGMEKLAIVVDAMADADNPTGKLLKANLDGARSQTASMTTLSENGYDIVLPTADLDDMEEVKIWDVHTGADYVAISRDKKIVYCVDSKSTTSTDANVELASTVPEHYRQQNENFIKKGLESVGIKLDSNVRFVYVKIEVPTGSGTSSLGEPNRIIKSQIVEEFKGATEYA